MSKCIRFCGVHFTNATICRPTSSERRAIRTWLALQWQRALFVPVRATPGTRGFPIASSAGWRSMSFEDGVDDLQVRLFTHVLYREALSIGLTMLSLKMYSTGPRVEEQPLPRGLLLCSVDDESRRMGELGKPVCLVAERHSNRCGSIQVCISVPNRQNGPTTDNPSQRLIGFLGTRRTTGHSSSIRQAHASGPNGWSPR
ncbi:hypothetical protein B0T16DRAFT_126706 [Cercophora newfieldiana]|uniref:Uncharacterized protein n=1 Tax=Cercophora newfieldiana TaxID=92897 RepID=A0AA39YBD3_9PEZI|nr:hypothetical protein B0T16DRAFT_126706 [Cercophora newfieldiana]